LISDRGDVQTDVEAPKFETTPVINYKNGIMFVYIYLVGLQYIYNIIYIYIYIYILIYIYTY
jgi:hypothetical protein